MTEKEEEWVRVLEKFLFIRDPIMRRKAAEELVVKKEEKKSSK